MEVHIMTNVIVNKKSRDRVARVIIIVGHLDRGADVLTHATVGTVS